jgi:predicted nucleotidyltransferase
VKIDLDTLQYPQNPKWLKEHVIFLTLAGSHCYNTNIEGSDVDIKGVATLPPEVVFGFVEKFDQAQGKEPYDFEVFSLLKFAKLAYDNNPNILELLFVDESDILLTTPQWERIRSIRRSFLSKRIAATFAGYAKGQLHKIRTHRGYLLNPVLQIPTREEFGLPARSMVPKLHAADASVTKVLDMMAGDWAIDKTQQLDLYKEAAKGLGFETNFVELLYKEKRYSALVSQKEAYDNWAKSRNPKRKLLEEKCGYDSKHLMHLVRLYRECLECLETGTLIIKRPDAKELIEIREGSWPFEKIEAWASDAESLIQLALKKTLLPSSPNLKEINTVVQSIVKEAALVG